MPFKPSFPRTWTSSYSSKITFLGGRGFRQQVGSLRSTCVQDLLTQRQLTSFLTHWSFPLHQAWFSGSPFGHRTLQVFLFAFPRSRRRPTHPYDLQTPGFALSRSQDVSDLTAGQVSKAALLGPVLPNRKMPTSTLLEWA
jgi:hypothetical protein